MAERVRAAAWALRGSRDDDVLARQVGGEVAPRGALADERRHGDGPGRCDRAFQFGGGGVRFQCGKGDLELIGEAPAALGPGAVLFPAHGLVHQLEMGVARQQIGIDRPHPRQFRIGFRRLRTRRFKLGAQQVNGVRGVAGRHGR